VAAGTGVGRKSTCLLVVVTLLDREVLLRMDARSDAVADDREDAVGGGAMAREHAGGGGTGLRAVEEEEGWGRCSKAGVIGGECKGWHEAGL
jgi:hypothetical protein